MLKQEDCKEITFKLSGKKKLKVKHFVFECKKCGIDILIPSNRLKNSTGCCQKCYRIKDINESGFQICKKCNKNLPISKFYKNHDKLGSSYNCVRCSNIRK